MKGIDQWLERGTRGPIDSTARALRVTGSSREWYEYDDDDLYRDIPERIPTYLPTSPTSCVSDSLCELDRSDLASI